MDAKARVDELVDLFAREFFEPDPRTGYLTPQHLRLLFPRLLEKLDRMEREDRIAELGKIDQMIAESGGYASWKRIRIMREAALSGGRQYGK